MRWNHKITKAYEILVNVVSVICRCYNIKKKMKHIKTA